MPKISPWSILGSFYNLKVDVKQCYQTGNSQYDKQMIENAKNGLFGEFLKTKSLCQTVLQDRSLSILQKIDGKCQKWSILRNFWILEANVKQWYQTRQFWYFKNWWKMPKLKKDISGDFEVFQVFQKWFKNEFYDKIWIFRHSVF